MIQIQHEHLDKLAQNHYQAISNYMGVKKVEKWNLQIKKDFSTEYDLERLLLASPRKLRELKEIFKGNKEEYKLFKTYYGYLNSYKEPKFFIEEDREKVAYNAYKLVQGLRISTCPYCNRNTVYNLNKSLGRTSEIDHFHPKEKYPYFAISFYNLIPSCKVCNKLKMEDEIEVNPYEASFDVNFKLRVKDSTFYYSSKGFELAFKSDDANVQKQINTFKLEDLYQNHKDIVLELIQKNAIYNESYLDELLTQYEGTLFKNREDLQRLISGGYISDEEIGKRPLSKLIKDISSELGLT
ncbi:MAG TPA: hypothetical protein ENK82_09940 [Campylobacterales bacterium]|nr:hypothetical protein [Campylobacterales bacterium]